MSTVKWQREAIQVNPPRLGRSIGRAPDIYLGGLGSIPSLGHYFLLARKLAKLATSQLYRYARLGCVLDLSDKEKFLFQDLKTARLL